MAVQKIERCIQTARLSPPWNVYYALSWFLLGLRRLLLALEHWRGGLHDFPNEDLASAR